MSRLVCILLLMLTVAVPARSQYHYVEKFLSYDDDKFISEAKVDPLGAVLVSGYLNGTLKAYRFATADSVAKWGPKLFEAEAWRKGKTYYSDDLVEYKGKAYSALWETKSAPDDYNNWMQVPQRDPVSVQRYFPSLHDTLARSDFLARMTEAAPVVGEWDPGVVYFNGDFVLYEEGTYKSLSENLNKNPRTSPDDWVFEYQGGIEFNSLRDLEKTSIVYTYTTHNSDTVWQPLMVTVYKRGLDVPEPVAHFFYEDVAAYLNLIALPVLDRRTYRSVDDLVFAFDELSCIEWMGWLKTKIKSNVYKPGSKDILNRSLYLAWLADTTTNKEILLQSYWKIVQMPDTREFLITRIDPNSRNGIRSTPFLRLPVKSLKMMFKTDKVSPGAFITYRDLLANPTYWKAYPEAHWLDSLKPFHATDVKAAVNVKHYYVLEKYYARLDSGNTGTVSAIKSIWPWLVAKLNSGKIREHDDPGSFFVDNTNWMKGNPWKLQNRYVNLDSTFSLSSFNRWNSDSIYATNDFIDMEIVYRKVLHTGMASGRYFRPVHINIIYRYNNNLTSSVSLNWNEFKDLLLGSDLKDKELFVQHIESATLDFYFSELIYAIMEEMNTTR